jgi:hypothetical protein
MREVSPINVPFSEAFQNLQSITQKITSQAKGQGDGEGQAKQRAARKRKNILVESSVLDVDR